MQTGFTLAQLADPEIRDADSILRSCVHCGFCNATCPTYLLTGDELDGPRGRIYLIKDMLETGRAPSAKVVTHIDRCLSCLSCMTTCPSGVHYMHLVDRARRDIERTFRRPLADRWLRWLLARVLPRPGRFRLALRAARLARPVRGLLGRRLRAMLALAPARPHRPARAGPRRGVSRAEGARRGRVALLAGCVQQTLAPGIDDAATRLLNRRGYDVLVAKGSGCCGALTHHLGQDEPALDAARRNVAAWSGEIAAGGLDAVVATAAGCGTMVKDYGFLLRRDPQWAERAAQIAGMARDVSELLDGSGLTAGGDAPGLRVAYQAACSLRHGQGVDAAPKRLLTAAGYDVCEPAEAHLCCGSAGAYNILQPDIAGRLRARKAAALEALSPDAVATGNVGCMMQLGQATAVPVVHVVELLDWATGGPRPDTLAGAAKAR